MFLILISQVNSISRLIPSYVTSTASSPKYASTIVVKIGKKFRKKNWKQFSFGTVNILNYPQKSLERKIFCDSAVQQNFVSSASWSNFKFFILTENYYN